MSYESIMLKLALIESGVLPDILTVSSASLYAARRIYGACVISAREVVDYGQSAIDVEFTLPGYSGTDVMTVWVEADGRLYGEW